ncbi:hypothetical protein, variant 4 [Aphanomyces invadans]|uniref:RRM domain-containing protein n=2 Tax=Aphanomyces invadans TaxID=157072 RepID=A0A024TGP3_9STRA|nr:hypothetical protein, variant 4 [Aphanomyces invadans]ETV93320.1 hypothetical protein, variant 4 [Aphanomyces invadans]|eukprot:XP_008877974.1 hypothetical protein, variant 4 [Aphanomyces invadans]
MTSTIFVRNLAYGTTQQQLEELFGDIGPVKKVSVIKDKGRAKTDMTTRGFAFVKFAMEADAKLAMEKLNNSDYGGRKLCIDLAKEKKGPKPLAHQKPPVVDVSATHDISNDIEAAPDDADEHATSEKKAKKARSKSDDVQVAQDHVHDTSSVSEVTSKKEKRKAKKQKREADDALATDAAGDAIEEVEEAPAKKEKQKKEAKTAKENVRENTDASLAPTSKKRKLDVQVDDDAAKLEKAPQVAEGHVQSERNARRREHRELLRKMKERQEASATVEEKSVAIYGLGPEVTEKALKIKMKKIGEAINIEWKEDIVNGKTQHVAYVEWANVATKTKALEKLDQHVFKGFTMTARGLESTTTGLAQKDGVRLIVRNLQFDVKDADLEKVFGKHGPLAEVRVVRMPVDASVVPDAGKVVLGRSRGFGFVQFKNKVDAQHAIETLNSTKLKGREIVVDYAVAKSEYVKAQAAQTDSAPATEAGEKDAEESDDEEGDNDEAGGEAPDLDQDENTLEMDDDDDDDIDALLDAKEEEEEDDANASTGPKLDTDSQRERTVFIRNLSFQTTEDGLAEAFKTQFGPVEYARVVMDRGSGLSKGVAFVRFRSKDDADAAIARGSVPTVDQPAKKKRDNNVSGGLFNSAMLDGDGIYVDGRLLSVTRAVAKHDADRLTEENSAKRKAVDKRNMYLAYEGTINVNKAAESELALPKMDIEKRRRAIKEKKEKLKNPLFFISPTRLSVRNVALGVDEKTLKTVFREAAIAGLQEHLVNMNEVKAEYQLKKGLPVKIILCKIVRDTENLKAGEDPRSRGYGFVEFSQHVHALAALRKLNNNPAYTEYSGRGVKPARGTADKDKTRLIVEFALENHGKLKLREKRMNDAKKRRDEELMLRKAQGEVIEKVERKSRGKRQREAKARRANEPAATSVEPAAKKPKTAQAPQAKPQSAINNAKHKKNPAKKVAPAAAGLVSRKERKGSRAKKEEKSFEDMVDSYKKKLFATVEDSESRGRWFD